MTANRDYPHRESLLQPGAGPRQYTLTLNDFGGQSGDEAHGAIFERVLSTTQANVLAGGVRIKTITTRESPTAMGIVTNYTRVTNALFSIA